MQYKCPYCLHSFSDTEVHRETRDGMIEYFCPNEGQPEAGIARCSKRLPLNFLESESIVLALTGGMYVGKTYYFIALLYQLKFNETLHQLGIQGDIIASDRDKEKLDKFYQMVKQGVKLDATDFATVLNSIIHLTITKGDKEKHVYLNFFDNPGEGFNKLDIMRDQMPNVYKADGLLFLVEPKQIKKFWKTLLKQDYIRDENQSPDDFYTILNNVIQLIKHVRHNPAETINQSSRAGNLFADQWEAFRKAAGGSDDNSKVNIPLAICISKFDQLAKGVHVTIPYDEKELDTICMRDNRFDEEVINTISSELEDVLTGPPDGEAKIKNLLKANLTRYAFFGVKSIDVDEHGLPVRLNPQGVVLPLIWLLIRLKLY